MSITNLNSNRRGAIVPLVAVLLGVLILVIGLMVEVNWLHQSKFETQSAADMASRSALAALYNSKELPEDAIADAKHLGAVIANLNSAAAEVTSEDVVLGFVGNNQKFIGSDDFGRISASEVNISKDYRPILGKTLAKENIELGVRSVAETSPIKLVLCLDASRSMNTKSDGKQGEYPPGATSSHEPPRLGSRWMALTDETALFFNDLEPKSSFLRLGLTSFGGGGDGNIGGVPSPLDEDLARTEYDLGQFKQRRNQVLRKLDAYSNHPALGIGTSIYDGINHSIDVLLAHESDAQKFIVLLSDGLQSAGVYRPSELIAAERAVSEGIVIFTIAYSVEGGNLEEIAAKTGGEYLFAENPEELRSAFSTIAAKFPIRISQ